MKTKMNFSQTKGFLERVCKKNQINYFTLFRILSEKNEAQKGFNNEVDINGTFEK